MPKRQIAKPPVFHPDGFAFVAPPRFLGRHCRGCRTGNVRREGIDFAPFNDASVRREKLSAHEVALK
jgi:hypothetical protein